MKKNLDTLEELNTIHETIHYVKCDRCKNDLQHWRKNTQVIYCNRCGGKFCLNCWGIQRAEEEGMIAN